MAWTNYHSHTNFSDGKLTAKDYVLAALEQNVFQYGFSDHAPVQFECEWCIDPEKLSIYYDTVDQLKSTFSDKIDILKSLEIDYIPGEITNSDFKNDLDYCVGSVHFGQKLEDGTYWVIDGPSKEFDIGVKELYDDNIQLAVEQYFALNQKMLLEDPPDILGHFDKVKMHNKNRFYFSEDASWYKDAIVATLETAKKQNVIVEINTRGRYKKISDYYPSQWVWREIKERNIPIVLNSDCHHPREITKEFSLVAEELASIGIKELMVFENGGFVPRAFDGDGVILVEP